MIFQYIFEIMFNSAIVVLGTADGFILTGCIALHSSQEGALKIYRVADTLVRIRRGGTVSPFLSLYAQSQHLSLQSTFVVSSSGRALFLLFQKDDLQSQTESPRNSCDSPRQNASIETALWPVVVDNNAQMKDGECHLNEHSLLCVSSIESTLNCHSHESHYMCSFISPSGMIGTASICFER